MSQTRFQFLSRVIKCLSKDKDAPFSGRAYRGLLAREVRRHPSLHCVYGMDEVIRMLAALAQYELTRTGKTALHKDPVPQTPTDAAVHIQAIINRINSAMCVQCGSRVMSIVILSFIGDWPSIWVC